MAGDCPVNETTEGGSGARFQVTTHQVTGSEALSDQRINLAVAHTSYTFNVTDTLAQMRGRVELTPGGSQLPGSHLGREYAGVTHA